MAGTMLSRPDQDMLPDDLPRGAERGMEAPASGWRRFAPRHWPIWPRSLAARTALVLLLGLVFIEAIGLGIHIYDRISLERIADQREEASRIASIYRAVAETVPDEREAEIVRLHMPPKYHASIGPGPDIGDLMLAPAWEQRELDNNINALPFPARLHPTQRVIGAAGVHRFAIALRLPNDDRWLNIQFYRPSPNPLREPLAPITFVLITLAGGGLTLWAIRRLTQPLRTLAAAAHQLGRDVYAPPLPERGPLEIATAAHAFNLMASRIRRFVSDRTLMLTAIGHDLRTPITRMKLRAEFIDDDDLRSRFLADLDELEAMVAATLAFGRDSANREPIRTLDLRALLRTVLDDATDGRPDLAGSVQFDGPQLTIQARPVALKRVFANLVGNALAYGGAARMTLHAPTPVAANPRHRAVERHIVITIDDDGPGIPPEQLDRVFEPFYRVEDSRNRETGGTGLGLAIARNIIRAHGGDITLANRRDAAGRTVGLRVSVTLPA